MLDGEGAGKSRPDARRPLMELVIPDPLPEGLEERSRRGAQKQEQRSREGDPRADHESDGGEDAADNPRELKEGEVPVAAALLFCFPEIFPSASFAKRACRKGGSLQAFHPKKAAPFSPAAVDGEKEELEGAAGAGDAGDAQGAATKLKIGRAVACVDRVQAGGRLLLVVYKGEPPKGFVDAYGRAGGRYWEESQKDGAGGGGKRLAPNATWDGVLEIVEEDEDYAVVVKPPALPSHSCAGVGSDVKSALVKSLGHEPGGYVLQPLCPFFQKVRQTIPNVFDVG